MATLKITGTGSVLYLKKRDDGDYDFSTYILSDDIEAVTIDDEEVDYELVDVGDLLTHCGFERGNTTMQVLFQDDEYFELEFTFEDIPEADDYKIRIKHVREGDYLEDYLGTVILPELVEVNGEEFLSDEPYYEGDILEYEV